MGGGGEGNVFEVEYDNRNFALKIINDSGTPEELNKEVTILKEIEHDGILKYFGSESIMKANNSEESKEKEFLVVILLEMCDSSLFQLLKNKISENQVLEFFKQICAAIDVFHYPKKDGIKPIIHRDLKPGNILIKDGKIKISDFGISKQKKTFDVNNLSIYTHQEGTLNYMPPEAKDKSSPVNGKWDIYSLGVVLDKMMKNCIISNENIKNMRILTDLKKSK